MTNSGAIRKPYSAVSFSPEPFVAAKPLDNAAHSGERAQCKHLLGVCMRSGNPLLLLCSLLVSASAATAQGQPARKVVTVEGVVVDGASAPIPSAEVGLTLEGSPTVFVRAGNDGKFSFSNVAAGPGKLTVRRMGYRVRTIPLDMYKVNAGEPLVLKLVV